MKTLWAWVQVLVGSVLMSLAFVMFFIPCDIAPGGVSGLATLIHAKTGWPVGLTMACINVPIFIIASRLGGVSYLFRSLVATGVMSLLVDVLPAPEAVTGIAGGDVMLATLYGGALMGFGLGLVVRGQGSTGGTDMIAQIVHWLLPSVKMATVLFIVDFLVVAGAGIVFGPRMALYALIAVFMTSWLCDYMQFGIAGAKACWIITGHPEEIARRVLEELGRGVTALNGRGMYSGRDRPTLLSIVSRSEVVRIKRIIEQEDEHAFVVVTDATEVLGEGFTRPVRPHPELTREGGDAP